MLNLLLLSYLYVIIKIHIEKVFLPCAVKGGAWWKISRFNNCIIDKLLDIAKVLKFKMDREFLLC